MNFQLRLAHPSEASALADLRVAAMRPSLEAIGRFDAQRARERFLNGFIAEQTRVIMIEAGVAGLVVTSERDSQIELEHLYIQPRWQGRGLGSHVLQIIFSEADSAQKPIRVGALAKSPSNDFYQRHGFYLVEVAEWDNYYVRNPQ